MVLHEEHQSKRDLPAEIFLPHEQFKIHIIRNSKPRTNYWCNPSGHAKVYSSYLALQHPVSAAICANNRSLFSRFLYRPELKICIFMLSLQVLGIYIFAWKRLILKEACYVWRGETIIETRHGTAVLAEFADMLFLWELVVLLL